MNTFDLYIQYANSEGFGLPQVEAAACAVPVMSIDYSAMSSVIRKLEGYPLKVKAVYQELETGCNRAIPDNDYTANKINEFFNLSEEERKTFSNKVKSNFDKHYQWDATAKKWEDYFDSVVIPPPEQTWSSPPRIHKPSVEIPDNISAREYVQWLIINVLGEPERLNTYMEARMIRDLNHGMFIQGTGDTYINEDSYQFVKPQYEPFNKETAYNIALQRCHHRNKWEMERDNRVQ